MTGSASTARCSGRTVAHPAVTKSPVEHTSAPSLNNTASSLASVLRGRERKGTRGFSEVDTEASLVHLGIAIRVFREKRQVAGLEADENSHPEREQKPGARARRPNGFFAEDELIDVGEGREATDPQHGVRLDRPVRG